MDRGDEFRRDASKASQDGSAVQTVTARLQEEALVVEVKMKVKTGEALGDGQSRAAFGPVLWVSLGVSL